MSEPETRTDLNKATRTRAANERIVQRAITLRFVSAIPLLCECDNPKCATVIPVDRTEYLEARAHPAHFLTAPDHHLNNATPLVQNERYWIHAASPSSLNKQP